MLLLAAAAIGGFLWWMQHDGERWLQRTARERLNEVVWKACVPGYHFTVDSVTTDFWKGDLRLTGLRLDFDSALTDSLRQGIYKYLFAAEAGTIRLHGVSYWRLVLLREFHARSLELRDPQLRYDIGDERVRLDAPFDRLRAPGAGPLDLLTVDSLVVRDARAIVHDLRGRLPVLHVAGLAVAASEVRIVHVEGSQRADLRTGAVDLALDSLNAEVADAYRLHIGRVRLSGRERRVTVDDLALHPLGTDIPPAFRTTVLDLHIAGLVMQGIDIGHLIADQALEMSALTVVRPVLDARLDKRRPPGPSAYTRLPPEGLKAIDFPLRVDTVHVVDGELRYAESHETSGAWGRLSFTALQATLTGIDNSPPQGVARPGIDAAIACTFQDSAALTARYHVTPDLSDAFTFEATVTDLPFTQLDPMTAPLLRLSVNAGELHRMHLLMKGDDDRARGTMELDYTGLHAQVAPDASAAQRHSLFGDLLDHLLDADNGGGLSDRQQRSYVVEREKDRSLFTYIWHVTRMGLKRDLVPGIRERVGDLLKKERVQRQERRAIRRARR